MKYWINMNKMDINSKIYIAGHRGLVWSAIKRKLESLGYSSLILRTHEELDLLDSNKVKEFFEAEKPEYIFLAAAKVGWIMANNDYPAEFIYSNLQIQNNIIHNSYTNGVKKLLFLWSSCIYPKLAPQPMKEEYLLSWPLEPTNEPYAIAKIAGIKMCQSYNRQYRTEFIACMPTNLYGPNDNFDLQSSHVLPAMIRKFHDAKKAWAESVTLWWDWTPMREFLYVDDMADACIFLMNRFSPTPEQNEKWEIFFNIWTWLDVTIRELAEIIQNQVWFKWEIIWDTSKPNWTPRKLQDVTRINNLWWNHKIGLEEGISLSYAWYLNNIHQ
ncbi:MAG: NAD-dependent epimerase/dehydratase [uncultured bacterium (gcode 4)]|uniref:GDP-L-fucose synthase n=1 Tax=uncultured bacterium (gcode 4) TaxID=1234023 RepID=K2G281_9BACT|nr:MAG: NAD-dependent epimerase/dehydratase [uncultured bacterium (gcode 4)]